MNFNIVYSYVTNRNVGHMFRVTLNILLPRYSMLHRVSTIWMAEVQTRVNSRPVDNVLMVLFAINMSIHDIRTKGESYYIVRFHLRLRYTNFAVEYRTLSHHCIKPNGDRKSALDRKGLTRSNFTYPRCASCLSIVSRDTVFV